MEVRRGRKVGPRFLDSILVAIGCLVSLEAYDWVKGSFYAILIVLFI